MLRLQQGDMWRWQWSRGRIEVRSTERHREAQRSNFRRALMRTCLGQGRGNRDEVM